MEKSVLSKKELALLQLALLQLARECISKEFTEKGPGKVAIPTEISNAFLKEKRGVFVTLHKKGRLRGCIGNIEPVKTLEAGVRENAVFAAFKDSRFAPLTLDELALIDIEISILSKPKPLAYKDARQLICALVPGEDGVILEKNHHRATFLPQVWEQLPTPEEFLSHLCSKAGLAANEWETAGLKVHTYQVQSFGEKDG